MNLPTSYKQIELNSPTGFFLELDDVKDIFEKYLVCNAVFVSAGLREPEEPPEPEYYTAGQRFKLKTYPEQEEIILTLTRIGPQHYTFVADGEAWSWVAGEYSCAPKELACRFEESIKEWVLLKEGFDELVKDLLSCSDNSITLIEDE